MLIWENLKHPCNKRTQMHKKRWYENAVLTWEVFIICC